MYMLYVYVICICYMYMLYVYVICYMYMLYVYVICYMYKLYVYVICICYITCQYQASLQWLWEKGEVVIERGNYGCTAWNKKPTISMI